MSIRTLSVLLLLSSSACAARIFSPPSGSFPVESPRTLSDERRAVGADVFAGGALFGPELTSTRATYRHGLAEQLELSISPAFTIIHDAKPSDSHPGIYALRAGLKHGLLRHVAVSGGLGAGASAAGGFVSPDLGVSAGYENRYLVPFVTARSFVSVPVEARRVHFTTEDNQADDADDEDEAPDVYRLRPRTTFGFQLALGARLPLTFEEEPEFEPSLACALGWNVMRDTSSQGKETYAGIGCSAELVF